MGNARKNAACFRAPNTVSQSRSSKGGVNDRDGMNKTIGGHHKRETTRRAANGISARRNRLL
jgi:hypothetical protein